MAGQGLIPKKQGSGWLSKAIQEANKIIQDTEKYAYASDKAFYPPNKTAQQLEAQYKAEQGLKTGTHPKIKKLDKDRAMRIADAYEEMKHDPFDPQVRKSYEALANETIQQYKKLLDEGVDFEYWRGKGEPYKSSTDMAQDLEENNRLKVLATEGNFGQGPIDPREAEINPMLQKSGFKDNEGNDLLINDLFRGVHDYFGHTSSGTGFGAIGEENAWDVHQRMFSPDARRALTTETRGQNSWVNYGPQMRDAQGNLLKPGDPGYLSPQERAFADQKIGLLPDEFVDSDYYTFLENPNVRAGAKGLGYGLAVAAGAGYADEAEGNPFFNIGRGLYKAGDGSVIDSSKHLGSISEMKDRVVGGGPSDSLVSKIDKIILEQADPGSLKRKPGQIQYDYEASQSVPAVRKRDKIRLEKGPVVEGYELDPHPVMGLEQIISEGRPFFPFIGDASRAGGTLKEMYGIPLDVPYEGGIGHDVRAALEGNPGSGWASMQDAAGTFMNRAREVERRTGLPPIAQNALMGESALDFAHHIFDPMYFLAKEMPITKKNKEKFDRKFREVFPKWKGLDDPDSYNQLWQPGMGSKRSAFSRLMGSPEFRDLGFPILQDVRRAAARTDLQGGWSRGQTGLYQFTPDTSLDVTQKDIHKTYSHDIPGVEGSGSRLPDAYPLHVNYPEAAVKNLNAVDKEGNPLNYGSYTGKILGETDTIQFPNETWQESVGHFDDWVNKEISAGNLMDRNSAIKKWVNDFSYVNFPTKAQLDDKNRAKKLENIKSGSQKGMEAIKSKQGGNISPDMAARLGILSIAGLAGLSLSNDADSAVINNILKAINKAANQFQDVNETGKGLIESTKDIGFPKAKDEAEALIYDQLRTQEQRFGEKVFDPGETKQRGSGAAEINRYELPSAYKGELEKIGVSTPDIVELDPQTGTKEFLESINKAKSENKYGASVYVYPEEDYKGMRLFLTDDGTAGYAIKPDGDIVSAFSTGKNPGVAPHLLLNAIEQGGNKLDAFDTVLPDLYSRMGFRETGRETWNEDFAPEDWDKEVFSKFKGGEPDISYMEYSSDPSKPIPRTAQGPVDLDMSQNARLQRAKDMGFDTDNVYYHGTFEDFNEFNEYAADLKSTTPDYSRFGFHFSPIKDAAENRLNDIPEIAKREGRNVPANSSQVMETYLKYKNPLRLSENRSGRWGAVDIYQAIMNEAEIKGVKGVSDADIDAHYDDAFEINGEVFVDLYDVQEQREAIRKWLSSMGYDSIVYENDFEGGGDSVIIFDPSNIRSVNAAFDPDKKDSSNLLASTGAGLVAGSAALGSSPEVDAGMTHQPYSEDQNLVEKRFQNMPTESSFDVGEFGRMASDAFAMTLAPEVARGLAAMYYGGKDLLGLGDFQEEFYPISDAIDYAYEPKSIPGKALEESIVGAVTPGLVRAIPHYNRRYNEYQDFVAPIKEYRPATANMSGMVISDMILDALGAGYSGAGAVGDAFFDLYQEGKDQYGVNRKSGILGY